MGLEKWTIWIYGIPARINKNLRKSLLKTTILHVTVMIKIIIINNMAENNSPGSDAPLVPAQEMDGPGVTQNSAMGRVIGNFAMAFTKNPGIQHMMKAKTPSPNILGAIFTHMFNPTEENNAKVCREEIDNMVSTYGDSKFGVFKRKDELEKEEKGK